MMAARTNNVTWTEAMVSFQKDLSSILTPLALIPGGGEVTETITTNVAITTLIVVAAPPIENLAIDLVFAAVPNGTSAVALEEISPDLDYLKSQEDIIGNILSDAVTIPVPKSLQKIARYNRFNLKLFKDVFVAANDPQPVNEDVSNFTKTIEPSFATKRSAFARTG